MKLRGSVTALLVHCFAGQLCFSQATDRPPAFIEIKIPNEIPSEKIFGRYSLGGDLGGWIRPRAGTSLFRIRIFLQSPESSRFKAILYAPGCSLQTFDLPAIANEVQHYLFRCDVLPSVAIRGTIDELDKFYGHKMKVDAKYIARWAGSFLGNGEELATEFPIDSGKLVSDGGAFQLMLPDFSHDALASSAASLGEFRITARDMNTGRELAILAPKDGNIRAKMGGLQILKDYPSTIPFDPCGPAGFQPRNSIGFSIRQGRQGTCGQ